MFWKINLFYQLQTLRVKVSTLKTLHGKNHTLEVVSRSCEPQVQVGKSYSYFFNLRPNIFKSGCSNNHFIPTVVSATGVAGDSCNHPLMKSSMLSGEHHCGISDWCGWWFLQLSWCFELTSVNAFFRFFFNMFNVINIIIFFFIHTLTHYVITRFLRFPEISFAICSIYLMMMIGSGWKIKEKIAMNW